MNPWSALRKPLASRLFTDSNIWSQAASSYIGRNSHQYQRLLAVETSRGKSQMFQREVDLICHEVSQKAMICERFHKLSRLSQACIDAQNSTRIGVWCFQVSLVLAVNLEADVPTARTSTIPHTNAICLSSCTLQLFAHLLSSA